jgi:hypothetical protein
LTEQPPQRLTDDQQAGGVGIRGGKANKVTVGHFNQTTSEDYKANLQILDTLRNSRMNS